MGFSKKSKKFSRLFMVALFFGGWVHGECKFAKLSTEKTEVKSAESIVLQDAKKAAASQEADAYLKFLGRILRYEENARKRSLLSTVSGALLGSPHRNTKIMLQDLKKELKTTLSPTEMSQFLYGLNKQLERGHSLEVEGQGFYRRVSGDFSESESRNSLVGGTLENDGVKLSAYRKGLRSYLYQWANESMK